MKEIVIRRRMWGRGNSGGYLRNSVGKQCCLGFVCRAFGVPLEAIVGQTMPERLDDDKHRVLLPAWLLRTAAEADVSTAAGVNDDVTLTNEERELKIAAIFKKHGLKAVFKP